MSILSGIAGQAGRNAVLEPWGANTRSADGSTRAGELVTDGLFIGGGGTAAGFGIKGAIQSGNLWAKAGWAALAGVGVLAAATGVKNLFAKLPGSHPDPKPEPTPTPGPTPSPTPGPKPEPTPGPTPTPTPEPEPEHPKPPKHDPAPPVQPTPEPAPKPVVHAVRPGENLSFIASCYFVNWRDLYTLNRDTIGPNPDALRVGMKLEIPSKDYHGPSFQYTPTVKGGVLPNGLVCSPDSPKAQAQQCES
jgi:hypothetical protein